jgi:hypothetical protein
MSHELALARISVGARTDRPSARARESEPATGLDGFWCTCGRLGYRARLTVKGCRMTKPIDRDPIFRGYVFDADIILLCVRWYISYRLTYRDLVEMLAERGVGVAHTTILRWVLRFISGVREALGSPPTTRRCLVERR